MTEIERLRAELAAANARVEGLRKAAIPVRDALDAWRKVLRGGRTVDASITGLGDMIRSLDAALAQPSTEAGVIPAPQKDAER